MESVTLNNRYRLLELVGSGGMAVVYRAVDTLLERQVAVKVLRESYAGDPAFLRRFQREARAVANLDHPNIVTVYDVGQDGDRHYIVMEYVDGQDLKTMIRQRGRLQVDEALRIAAQVAAGVGYAHKAGVIHCDVKPQNVLVTHDCRAKVTDFGIARALSEAGLTESETVWGSPLYFSPEQASGEPPTPASDVYSIGVVMYEMLTGTPPFQAEKSAALALKHMREEPPPLVARNSQVPPQLEWIVRKVLAKEPAARYRDAEQLAHVLQEYRQHGEELTTDQPAVSPEAGEYTPKGGAPVVDRLEAQAEPPPDWLTWVLGAVAFFAVIGLIPLWLMVYRAYSASPVPRPTLTPTPLVTLTPTPRVVQVPRFEALALDEARDRAEDADLELVVEEERDDPQAPDGVILAQTPAPGESLVAGSTVSVVVNLGRRELVVPDVVGYELEEVREPMENDGMELRIEEVWSTDPIGQIMDQVPESGETVLTGDPVTLTVSGGVAIPIELDIEFDEKIVLDSAEIRQSAFRSGGAIALRLNWRALESIDTRYVVFVHLVDDPAAPPLSQQDREPFVPTVEWVPGVEVSDPHQVDIPVELPPGLYQIRVGLYPQGQPNVQLPVTDLGHTVVDSGRVLVTEIEIGL